MSSHTVDESNRSLQSRENNQASTLIFPSATKCEFCDVTFRCDSDLSKHLTSVTHRTKKIEYLSALDENGKVTERCPTNLNEVFGLLKIRSNKDLVDLASKDFFVIPDDNIANIGEDLPVYLTCSIMRYEARNMPPGVRKKVEDSTLDTIRRLKQNKKTSPQKKLQKTILNRDEEVVPTLKSAVPEKSCPKATPSASAGSDRSKDSANAQKGPKLGQNWNYTPIFAKIKTEPKE